MQIFCKNVDKMVIGERAFNVNIFFVDFVPYTFALTVSYLWGSVKLDKPLAVPYINIINRASIRAHFS